LQHRIDCVLILSYRTASQCRRKRSVVPNLVPSPSLVPRFLGIGTQPTVRRRLCAIVAPYASFSQCPSYGSTDGTLGSSRPTKSTNSQVTLASEYLVLRPPSGFRTRIPRPISAAMSCNAVSCEHFARFPARSRFVNSRTSKVRAARANDRLLLACWRPLTGKPSEIRHGK